MPAGGGVGVGSGLVPAELCAIATTKSSIPYCMDIENSLCFHWLKPSSARERSSYHGWALLCERGSFHMGPHIIKPGKVIVEPAFLSASASSLVWGRTGYLYPIPTTQLISQGFTPNVHCAAFTAASRYFVSPVISYNLYVSEALEMLGSLIPKSHFESRPETPKGLIILFIHLSLFAFKSVSILFFIVVSQTS